MSNLVCRDFQEMVWKLPISECRLLLDVLQRRLAADAHFYDKFLEGRFAEGLACPHCGSTGVVRNGHAANGAQRYFCKDCRKSFTATTGTIFARTVSPDTWRDYLLCMLDGLSLRKSAKRCGIALSTSFLMRHRVLDAVRKARAGFKLHGIVEIDELFFDLSFKGNHHGNFTLPREIHHRGSLSNQRGSSLHKVCVISARARNGDAVLTVSNLGNASKADVMDAFDGVVWAGSTLCSDGTGIYEELAHEDHLTLERLYGKERIRGIFHIQNLNSLHSSLRGFLRPFRGVSTKYLPNYLTWHVSMGGSVVDVDEQLRRTRSECLAYGTSCGVRELPDRAPVPITSTRQKDCLDEVFKTMRLKAALSRRKLKHPKRQAPAIDEEVLRDVPF